MSDLLNFLFIEEISINLFIFNWIIIIITLSTGIFFFLLLLLLLLLLEMLQDQHIRVISVGSCDTEAEKSALPSQE